MGGYFAQEDRSEERGYEGDAGGGLVCFGILVVESKNLRAAEALYGVSIDRGRERAGSLRGEHYFQ